MSRWETLEQRRVRGKALRIKRAAMGRCCRCDEPAMVDRSMCPHHLAYERVYQLARYYARTGRVQRINLCAECDQPGHKSTTCPKLSIVADASKGEQR